MSNIESIEIHAGRPDFPFVEVRRVEVKCEATHAFMPAPTVEEANDRLRALASSVGANAVIETKYDSGISLTSWKSLKATGIAVIRQSDDRTCPICAETIKLAAKKCRYCGADLDDLKIDLPDGSAAASPGAVAQPETKRPSPQRSIESQEPLRDNNNSAIWWIMGLLILFFFLALVGL